MNTIESVTLEVTDASAATDFYATAFGLEDRVRVQPSEAATTGFRGFTMSLVVSQPSTVRTLVGSAIDAGATTLKPVEKSLWGVGGVVQAPDGTVWNIATSAKKDTGADTGKVEQVVLLLGAENVGASKRFYVDRGLAVGKGMGGYVEFAMPSSPVGLGLLRRRALAKSAGVAPEGSGSHRVVINGDAGSITDPDGFAWA